MQGAREADPEAQRLLLERQQLLDDSEHIYESF